MGFWSGIKHALNSTLGTKEFKPLDIQIAEKTTLYASDEEYATISEGMILVDESKGSGKFVTYPQKLKMLSTGNFNIAISFKFDNRVNVGQNVYFFVRKNGDNVYNFNGSASASNNGLYEIKQMFSFERNDVFDFEVQYYNSSSSTFALTVSPLKILGTVRHNVMQLMEV